VVLGSSTAAGTGPADKDSAWVVRYTNALKAVNKNFKVVNLAIGGYTTYQILPSDYEIPSEIKEAIDTNSNITKALSYKPYAIIINMPSNDAAKNYPIEAQLDNFDIVCQLAAKNGIRVWIATSQPRNFSNSGQIKIQAALKDTLLQIYGEHVIDFWTVIADDYGLINEKLNCGDGIHLNDAGHKILFDRVWAKRIDTLALFKIPS
jgi:lysophospholipase L1-like esterase